MTRGRMVVGMALCLTVSSGCAEDFHLVSRGIRPRITGWHYYATARQAESSLEEAVLKVAGTKTKATFQDYEVVFINDDLHSGQAVQCVNVVSRTESDDPYAYKNVVRYRVLDGRIVAMSDPSEEFFVNAEFERAVVIAAAKAWSPDPVILYEDGGRNVSIASAPINRCTAKVMVFSGDAVGTPMASKRVTVCTLY